MGLDRQSDAEFAVAENLDAIAHRLRRSPLSTNRSGVTTSPLANRARSPTLTVVILCCETRRC